MVRLLRRLPPLGLLVALSRVLGRFQALLFGLLALPVGVGLALAFLRLPLEPVSLGLLSGVLGLGLGLCSCLFLRFEGFGVLPVGVSGRRRREAVLDLAPVEARERAFDGLALGVAQGAVDVLPFGVQLAEFFGDRAGFLGVLVVVVPPSGGLAGAAFVTGGGGAEVAAGVVREAPLGVAAGVELGGVAGALERVVRQFRPARPLALGRVLQPVALAVDRVEFGRFAAQFPLGG